MCDRQKSENTAEGGDGGGEKEKKREKPHMRYAAVLSNCSLTALYRALKSYIYSKEICLTKEVFKACKSIRFGFEGNPMNCLRQRGNALNDLSPPELDTRNQTKAVKGNLTCSRLLEWG